MIVCPPPPRVAYSNRLVRLSVSPSVSPSVHQTVRPFFVRSITLKAYKTSTLSFIGRYISLRSAVHKTHYTKLHTVIAICPLFIFIIEFCPEHNSQRIQATDLKLYLHINRIENSSMHKNHNSEHHTFGVIALCLFSYLDFYVVIISTN